MRKKLYYKACKTIFKAYKSKLWEIVIGIKYTQYLFKKCN